MMIKSMQALSSVALLFAGSLLLNGWIGYQLYPHEFHADEFVGGILHLLLGVVPLVAGMILLIRTQEKLFSIESLRGAVFAAVISLVSMAGGFISGYLRWDWAFGHFLIILITSLFFVWLIRCIMNSREAV